MTSFRIDRLQMSITKTTLEVDTRSIVRAGGFVIRLVIIDHRSRSAPRSRPPGGRKRTFGCIKRQIVFRTIRDGDGKCSSDASAIGAVYEEHSAGGCVRVGSRVLGVL